VLGHCLPLVCPQLRDYQPQLPQLPGEQGTLLQGSVQQHLLPVVALLGSVQQHLALLGSVQQHLLLVDQQGLQVTSSASSSRANFSSTCMGCYCQHDVL
jgi:hypothetical protein